MNDTAKMDCPVDGTALVMSERSGIEIDYCPTCRGVWLDRGELDKIIERNSQQQAAAQPHSPVQGAWDQQDQQRGFSRGHGKPHKRRKSFLEELFD